MSDDFIQYFNQIVDQTTLISDMTLTLEKKIFGLDEAAKDYSSLFSEEIEDLKNLIHDMKIFVEGLLVAFEKFQETGSSFVTKEELEDLQLKTDKLDFAHLVSRKQFLQKLLKDNKAKVENAKKKK